MIPVDKAKQAMDAAYQALSEATEALGTAVDSGQTAAAKLELHRCQEMTKSLKAMLWQVRVGLNNLQ